MWLVTFDISTDDCEWWSCDFCCSVCLTRELAFDCGILIESAVKGLEVMYHLGI